MLLEQLTLDHYRNYSHLEARFREGAILLQGENAQGKTNLLEAIYLLATTKSSRSRTDADLISWSDSDPFTMTPFARITAHVARQRGPLDLEIVVQESLESAAGRTMEARLSGTRLPVTVGASGNEGSEGAPEPDEKGDGGMSAPIAGARKRFKINGVPRRAGEVVGQVNAVLFSPTDVDLVTGPPSARRRYLDVILCQAHPSYYRALQGYTRVIAQRNSLLKGIRDRTQPTEAILFWNEKLVEFGATVIAGRVRAVAHLAEAAGETHERLSVGRERLEVRYNSSVPLGGGETAGGIRDLFMAALEEHRAQEFAAGVSLLGPHRDDLSLRVNGVEAHPFGSRGQQRSVALALKMAELSYIHQEAGDWPILLLDDATSELDPMRRAAILALTRDHPQVFLTTAEPDGLTALLPEAAQVWHVEAGALHAPC